jgi:predicted nuclease of predicted toxin-antitoxin system
MALSRGLSLWLSSQGHDSFMRQSLACVVLPTLTSVARAESRIVVTADLDYPRLLALSTADRPAVILFRGGDWSAKEAIERLQAVLSAVAESELVSSLIVVEKVRIRRRRLPL